MEEWAYQTKEIPADSSAQYGIVEWKVEGNIGDTFHIKATLSDADDRVISANEYMLLIADQEEARKQCRERAKYFQDIKSKFHSADYYRFFSKFSGEKDYI